MVRANIMSLGRGSRSEPLVGVELSRLTRRKLLATGVQGLVGASLGAGLGQLPLLAQTPAGRPGSTDLGNGFHVLSLGSTNVLAVTDATGVALVDGAPAGRAGALTELLATLPQAGKVHTLFNTHWHPEQTGSNESLGQAGATIVAQENTKLWLTTDVTWPWSDETVRRCRRSRYRTKRSMTQPSSRSVVEPCAADICAIARTPTATCTSSFPKTTCSRSAMP